MIGLNRLCAIGCAAALVSVSAARGATITTSPTAPTANVLTSQLTDVGPGVQANDRDYTDNGGPPKPSRRGPFYGHWSGWLAPHVLPSGAAHGPLPCHPELRSERCCVRRARAER